jgi:Fur family transcriptional regulator, ferric uptake regulator
MEEPLELLNKHVKEKGLKSSAQRNVILTVMMKEKKHLTVDELYSLIKKENPEIGIATVYRTIHLLCDIGIVRELAISNAVSRYEILADGNHHDHLVCVSCGKFVEIVSSLIEKEQAKIAHTHGFILTNHTHVLYGRCPECSKEVSR